MKEKNINIEGDGAGREKRRISVPSSQGREELTRGPGKQVLPKLPGGGKKGAPGLAALRLTDCRGAERQLHPCHHQQEEKSQRRVLE